MSLSYYYLSSDSSMGERKTENLEVISSTLILNSWWVFFSTFYRYLRVQVYTPSYGSKIRVFLGSSGRRMRPEYYDLVHQLAGAR